MKNMLALAISIASQAFEAKIDKLGKPYILHCLRVMMNVDEMDPELQQMAVLHDVVEDCPQWTINDLRKLGFSERVLKGVELLTHKYGDSYDLYIRQISHSVDATRVKLADLRDNSDITRLKGLTKVDFDRLEKYHRAYTYLSKI